MMNELNEFVVRLCVELNRVRNLCEEQQLQIVNWENFCRELQQALTTLDTDKVYEALWKLPGGKIVRGCVLNV